MAYPTPHVYYSTSNGPSGTDNPYLSWFDYILDQTDIPQTISMSYANYEKRVPRGYCANRNNAMAVHNRFASGMPTFWRPVFSTHR